MGQKKPPEEEKDTRRLSVDASSVIGKDGGDEVVVLMPYTTLEEAAMAAERLRKRIEAMKFSVAKKNGHTKIITANLTCTIGIAQADFEQQEAVEEVKSFADEALKAGKRHHRNIVCITPPKKEGLFFDFPYIDNPTRKIIKKVGRYDHTDGEEDSDPTEEITLEYPAFEDIGPSKKS